VLFGAAAIVAAIMILYQRSEVYTLVISTSGTLLGMVLGMFLLGMLIKRANAGGLLVGLMASVVALLFAWGHVDGTWYGALSCVR
jgi:Na+/proline symporter